MQQDIDASLTTILAYQPIHSHLTTSGQPSHAQLADIAQAGYTLVINLALTNASNAIAGEDQRVLALGMDYLHLPMHWEQPSIAQAQRLLTLLQTFATEKIWLHCALNYRVSSLMYIYQTQYLQVPTDTALQQLRGIWTPNTVWQGVIDHFSTNNNLLKS